MNAPDESSLARDLAALLGDDRVRACDARESRAAAIVVEPRTVEELGELVRKCEGDHLALAPLGAARTLGALRQAPVALGVSLVRMNRVIAYEPDDMTVVTQAGVTLGALNQMAAARGQRLPVDAAGPEVTTIGAMIAAAKAGPLRLSEGTVRDLLIGITYVGHGGRVVHAGGRVVKNVTGYDLMKVMTGSFGTLGIITEAAFKVRPIPPNYAVATRAYPTVREAFDAAARVGAAAPLLHCEVLVSRVMPALGAEEPFALMAGFGGISAEVVHQRAQVIAALGTPVRAWDGVSAIDAYELLRDLEPPARALTAQLAVPPTELAYVVEEIGVEFRAHALCGVAQLLANRVSDRNEAHATIARWRAITHRAGGQLRVITCRSEWRDGLAIFDEPAPAALALMRRMKSAFDPHNIFNPNCFVGGI